MNRQHLAWALSTLALVPGSDIASAQMRTQSFQRETQFAYRIPDRFLALDLNHDGNISRDEMNRAENARFASATHGKNTMTPEQFGFLYTQQFRERTDALFRKLDWNGDGNLSLEEYASPKRARFEAFEDDRGEETCANAHVFRASFASNALSQESGRGRFCDENDLNHDGKVTHAEFDSSTVRQFASRTGGAKVMTEAQFRSDADGRYRSLATRIFRRLDINGDGQLSFGEFASSDQKLFARLDSNHDGVVSRSEVSSAIASGRTPNRS